MNDHPDIFPIRLGDLRDGLLDQVVTEVRHFAVPLMLNDDFIGSGVLVQIDNVFGILTAEHVVNKNLSAPFDNSLDSPKTSLPVTGNLATEIFSGPSLFGGLRVVSSTSSFFTRSDSVPRCFCKVGALASSH